MKEGVRSISDQLLTQMWTLKQTVELCAKKRPPASVMLEETFLCPQSGNHDDLIYCVFIEAILYSSLVSWLGCLPFKNSRSHRMKLLNSLTGWLVNPASLCAREVTVRYIFVDWFVGFFLDSINNSDPFHNEFQVCYPKCRTTRSKNCFVSVVITKMTSALHDSG